MRILGFGTYDKSKHPRIDVLLTGLRTQGHNVAEANCPLGLTTAERVAMLKTPWLVYRFPVRLLDRWIRIATAAIAARRNGPIDAVIVGYMGQFDVLLARLLFPRTTVALDLLIMGADTAQDRGVRSGTRLRALKLLDQLACACADLVLVDTEEHVSLLPATVSGKTVVVPVGAPPSWFAAARSGDRPDPASPLRVVFFGLFTPLQGAPVVGEAIGLLADDEDIEFTLIGTGQDYEACRQRAETNDGVDWVDWVDSDRLPQVVARHDVCLGIFGTTPKALRVVPNKVYQGAAAGCAVVTSDTPPQRRTLGDSALLVEPGNPDALAQTLRDLSADRSLTESFKTASRTLSSDRFTPEAIGRRLGLALTARWAFAGR